MIWFDGTDAMRQSATLPEYAAVRSDKPNFVAPVLIEGARHPRLGRPGAYSLARAALDCAIASISSAG